jgi:hypothetical protein
MVSGRSALAGLCVLIGVLALVVAPAWSHQLPYEPAGTVSGLPEPLVNPTGIGIDQATGDVYVADEGTDKINQFNAAGVWQSAVTVGGAPAGLAVDNSGGPSEGDVYVVVTASGVIYKFDQSLTGKLSPDLTTPEMGAGLLRDPHGVSVAPNGNVYVADTSYSENESDGLEFSSTGTLLNAKVFDHSERLNEVAIDPSGNLYSVGYKVSEYNSAEECVIFELHCDELNVYNGSEMAIDSEGDLFVSEFGSGELVASVDEFSPRPGHPPIQNEDLEIPTLLGDHAGAYVAGIAVVDAAPHALYVSNPEGGTVQIFKPAESKPPVVVTGEALEATPTTATVTGTVNPNDDKAEYSVEYGETEAYGARTPILDAPAVGEPVPVFLTLTGLTIGKTYHYRLVASNAKGGPIYGADKKLVVPEVPLLETSELFGTVAVLKGQLNPHGETGAISYRIDYNTDGSCTGGETTPAVEVGEGKQAHVEVELAGLQPNTQYTYCLVAINSSGVSVRSAEVSSTTSTAVLRVTNESFADVGSGGAVVSGQINPGPAPIESYYFEYGTSSGYGSTTPVEALGGVDEAAVVSAQLSGLAQDSEYHFRLVARSAGGEVTRGREVAFRTRSAGLLDLPDGRVYEMVSPAADDGANVFVPEMFTAGSQLPGAEGIQARLPFQPSLNGDAVAYAGEAGAGEGGSGSDAEGAGDEYLATRAAEGGWSQRNIQPQGVVAARYQAFSSDLSTGLLEWAENDSGEANGPLFVRNDSDGSYGALSPVGGAVYAGTSTQGSYLFMDRSGLYDSVGGTPSAVNVLPDGDVEGDATFGAPALRNAADNPPDLSHVISTDGARVFWSGLGSGAGLYVRENPGSPESPRDGQGRCTAPGDACTVQVDAKVQGASGSSGGGRFWTASSNGSKVFFTDESRLTSDSTAASGAPDLYEYEVNSETGGPGALRDLTVDAGEPADVQGVVGASEDGSFVYFVADGALAHDAQPQSCEAQPLLGESTGGCNLYVWHEGVVSFIAVLSSQDGVRVLPAAGDGSSSGEFGDWQPGLGHRTAAVTPDGESLVFMSGRSLTGYENKAVGPDGPVSVDEVFLYRFGEGVSCASCDQSGERPSAYADGAGGFLPVSWSDTYLPQWVSDDGDRVFFDSSESLAVQDSNGKQDVYEWEREGSGSCQIQGGCVYLLSRGASAHASWLLGASASGDDVFIITRAQLLVGGQSETYAVYDARVDGASPPAQAACPAGGCQLAPEVPPVFATPASSTFEGVGNFPPAPLTKAKAKSKVPAVKVPMRAQRLEGALRACAKKHGRTRRSCEARARKRYAAKKPARRSQ